MQQNICWDTDLNKTKTTLLQNIKSIKLPFWKVNYDFKYQAKLQYYNVNINRLKATLNDYRCIPFNIVETWQILTRPSNDNSWKHRQLFKILHLLNLCFLHFNAILNDIVFLFIILAKLCCQRLLLCNKTTIRCSVSVITLLLQSLAYFWMC